MRLYFITAGPVHQLQWYELFKKTRQKLTDGWIDGWMDGWTDGQTDGWMDNWANEQTDRQTDRQTDEWTNENLGHVSTSKMD